MNTTIPNNLSEFIDELPIQDQLKKELKQQLQAGQEESVKQQIAEILEEAQAHIVAQGGDELLDDPAEIEKAEQQLNAELAEIDRDATQLAVSITKDLDQNDMEAARKTINQV